MKNLILNPVSAPAAPSAPPQGHLQVAPHQGVPHLVSVTLPNGTRVINSAAPLFDAGPSAITQRLLDSGTRHLRQTAGVLLRPQPVMILRGTDQITTSAQGEVILEGHVIGRFDLRAEFLTPVDAPTSIQGTLRVQIAGQTSLRTAVTFHQDGDVVIPTYHATWLTADDERGPGTPQA